MLTLDDPLARQRFYQHYPAGEEVPSFALPIFINCFNRESPLRRLVECLLNAGYRRIVLLDNQSSYPPLLQYYTELADDPRITVIRLPGNLGHYAIWASGVLGYLGWRGRFAYTDPDVLPDDHCPPDFLEHFGDILDRYPWARKAGFGLVIDDIPDGYRFKNEVLCWERQFWDVPVGIQEYRAPIDTTFALYVADAHGWDFQAVEDAKYLAIRTGMPHAARHLDWYIDSQHPTEEQNYYRGHAIPGVTSWSLEDLPDNIKHDVELVRRGARIIPLDSQGKADTGAARTGSRMWDGLRSVVKKLTGR